MKKPTQKANLSVRYYRTLSSASGPSTYDDSIDFLQNKIWEKKGNPEKLLYTHHTCATDTNQVQLVLDSVINMVTQLKMKDSGLC